MCSNLFHPLLGERSAEATGSWCNALIPSPKAKTLVPPIGIDYCRHPNTIAYPEKFFESAQAIATHSHLRWPDLSREWIRRQQARIARAAEEIGYSGSPTRLSSRLSGLRTAEQTVNADPLAAEPAKKKSQKKGGKKSVPSKGKKDPKEGSHSGEGSLEGSLVEKTKKTKRSRESHGDGEGRDGLAEDSSGGLENEAPKSARERSAKKKGLLQRDNLHFNLLPRRSTILLAGNGSSTLLAAQPLPGSLARTKSSTPRLFRSKATVASLVVALSQGSLEEAEDQLFGSCGVSYNGNSLGLGLSRDSSRSSGSKEDPEEKEALRVKFEGLEATWQSTARRNFMSEKAASSERTPTEKEKAEAAERRLAQKLIEERQRLRDSLPRGLSRGSGSPP
ncbi:hypothetical protein Bca52824_017868 [Brassica carinata]|uniref:Uncharacterized protein n=1 Tax=Brassica carinata TaxID=52824 RepID=A0A8X7VNP1_BRACI|nr:hypothetical protein Bca52824_017868 [Brassica carinata]